MHNNVSDFVSIEEAVDGCLDLIERLCSENSRAYVKFYAGRYINEMENSFCEIAKSGDRNSFDDISDGDEAMIEYEKYRSLMNSCSRYYSDISKVKALAEGYVDAVYAISNPDARNAYRSDCKQHMCRYMKEASNIGLVDSDELRQYSMKYGETQVDGH